MPKLSQTIYNAKIVCRKINQNEKMKMKDDLFLLLGSLWPFESLDPCTRQVRCTSGPNKVGAFG